MKALNMITLKLITITAFSFLLLTGIQTKSYAAGALVITPTRVTFDDRTRSETVTIVNTSTETTTYRARFVRRNMLENGNLVDVEEGTEGMFSDEYIRYSPRQVTLAPGQAQIIRLLLRKPRDLAVGEYRSHMLFQALPDAKKSAIKPQNKEKPDAITVEITSLIGITIPVIVRHGTLEATAELANPELIPSIKEGMNSKIDVDILRSGTRSIYGDMKVEYIAEGDSTGKVISQIKGIAVYTPNKKRRFSINLDDLAADTLKKGQLNITYQERNTTGKNKVFSKVSLKLP